MRTFLLWIAAISAVAITTLFSWRALDIYRDNLEIHRLRLLQPPSPLRYSADMVESLPEPAQRYFNYTISEGAELYTVAEIQMQGRFANGSREKPEYLQMNALQMLAAPHGFLWKMQAGSKPMQISGSDSGKWTRFWLAGFSPVVRSGGSNDHARSAFGRLVAEALFWTPAALLPGDTVSWLEVDNHTARFIMRYDGMEQAVDMSVDKYGQPTQVVFTRWSDANPEKRYRLQPFGGYLSKFRQFEGFRLPTHVEAGNFFGTDDYFPFFIAEVSNVRYPPPER